MEYREYRHRHGSGKSKQLMCSFFYKEGDRAIVQKSIGPQNYAPYRKPSYYVKNFPCLLPGVNSMPVDPIFGWDSAEIVNTVCMDVTTKWQVAYENKKMRKKWKNRGIR